MQDVQDVVGAGSICSRLFFAVPPLFCGRSKDASGLGGVTTSHYFSGQAVGIGLVGHACRAALALPCPYR